MMNILLVSYDYQTYKKSLLVEPAISSITVMILLIVLLYFLIVRRYEVFSSKYQAFSSILLSSILLFFLITSLRTLNLRLLQDDLEDSQIGQGKIENIESSKPPVRYSHHGEVVWGVIIEIDGKKYYVMDNWYFSTGDDIVFEYLPNSNIILSIEHDSE